MDRFFGILSKGVHHFEGTINQYTGDGIMALFGAPIAHEDHARRACYAALHLREELRRYAEGLKRTPEIMVSGDGSTRAGTAPTRGPTSRPAHSPVPGRRFRAMVRGLALPKGVRTS